MFAQFDEPGDQAVQNCRGWKGAAQCDTQAITDFLADRARMLFINLNIGKGSGHDHSRTDYLDDTSYGSGNFPN